MTFNRMRNNVVKASEEIEKFKRSFNNLPPLYGVGGTAIGGYESMSPPDPPGYAYLPAIEAGSEYTLVVDLDETLVHYFLVNGSEGTFVVRPYCDEFLT